MFELNEFLDHFDRVRQRTRRVADCIPSEHVEWTYKPPSGSASRELSRGRRCTG